ncbi:MAG: hypothetical protein LAT81_07805 [Oceanicaulis sp.]|nr:hypothetical protein [Oceanicaulis sp.]
MQNTGAQTGHEIAHSLVTETEFRKRVAEYMQIARWVPREQFARESAVIGTKWFSYSFMSPLEATNAFADAYQASFRRKWRSTFDRDESEKKRGMPVGGILSNKREFNTFWNARLRIDEFGIPYDFFCNHAIQACLDRGAWRRIPRPGQIVTEYTIPKVLDAWTEWLGARFQFLEMPHYRIENFGALPAQLAYREWLISQIELRRATPRVIGTVCFLRRSLPVCDAIKHFGEERVEKAQQDIQGEVPDPEDVLEPQQMRMTCFGIPSAFDAAPSCATCPERQSCRIAGIVVQGLLKKNLKTDDPVRDRKNTQNRERQRRFRERQRQERASAETLHDI